MTSREELHRMVDDLSEPELTTAQRLLRALKDSDDLLGVLEDELDAEMYRRRCIEQEHDETETLEEFGQRVGLD